MVYSMDIDILIKNMKKQSRRISVKVALRYLNRYCDWDDVILWQKNLIRVTRWDQGRMYTENIYITDGHIKYERLYESAIAPHRTFWSEGGANLSDWHRPLNKFRFVSY